ncbi:hypothetical protein DFH11DRAFT_737012 [Phellopilus nigrolimitatus]|nr:hypothetical protein DFH11DRAFT_737012 [Phellopilus nigrolimitatus]
MPKPAGSAKEAIADPASPPPSKRKLLRDAAAATQSSAAVRPPTGPGPCTSGRRATAASVSPGSAPLKLVFRPASVTAPCQEHASRRASPHTTARAHASPRVRLLVRAPVPVPALQLGEPSSETESSSSLSGSEPESAGCSASSSSSSDLSTASTGLPTPENTPTPKLRPLDDCCEPGVVSPSSFLSSPGFIADESCTAGADVDGFGFANMGRGKGKGKGKTIMPWMNAHEAQDEFDLADEAQIDAELRGGGYASTSGGDAAAEQGEKEAGGKERAGGRCAMCAAWLAALRSSAPADSTWLAPAPAGECEWCRAHSGIDNDDNGDVGGAQMDVDADADSNSDARNTRAGAVERTITPASLSASTPLSEPSDLEEDLEDLELQYPNWDCDADADSDWDTDAGRRAQADAYERELRARGLTLLPFPFLFPPPGDDALYGPLGGCGAAAGEPVSV